jgi:hypothetical protein
MISLLVGVTRSLRCCCGRSCNKSTVPCRGCQALVGGFVYSNIDFRMRVAGACPENPLNLVYLSKQNIREFRAGLVFYFFFKHTEHHPVRAVLPVIKFLLRIPVCSKPLVELFRGHVTDVRGRGLGEAVTPSTWRINKHHSLFHGFFFPHNMAIPVISCPVRTPNR